MNAKRKHEPTEPTLTDLHRKALRVMKEHAYRDYTDREIAAIVGVNAAKFTTLCSDLFVAGHVTLSQTLRRCKMTDHYATTYQAKERS